MAGDRSERKAGRAITADSRRSGKAHQPTLVDLEDRGAGYPQRENTGARGLAPEKLPVDDEALGFDAAVVDDAAGSTHQRSCGRNR
jgi:hypothetical protein